MINDRILKKYLIWFPGTIIISIFIAIAFFIFSGRPDYAFKGFFFASGCLLAMFFLIWLYKTNAEIPENITTIQTSNKFFLVGYFFLFILLNISLFYNGMSLITKIFLFIILIYLLIQIWIKTDNSSCQILIQLILVQLFIIYANYVDYPYYFGGTDLLTHEHYINFILKTGTVISTSIDSSYSGFPLYHILYSMSILLFDLDFHVISYILTGVALSAFSIILFLYTKKVFYNNRIALLCVFSYVLIINGFFLSSFMIPRFLPVVAMIFILYLFLKISEKNTNKYTYFSLILFFSIFIILVHQVSVFFISLIFILYFTTEKWFNIERSNKLIFLAFFIISGLSYWFFVADLFSTNIINLAVQNDISFEIALVETASPDFLEVLINNIEQIPLIFFVFFGIGFSFFYHYKKNYFAYIFLSFFLCFTLIKTPIQNMTTIMEGFSFNRMALYCTPFISGIIAYSLFSYLSITKILTKNKLLLLSIFVILLFLLIGGYIQLIQFGGQNKEFFTNSELESITFIDEYAPFDSLIFMDYYTSRAFNSIYFKNIQSFKDLEQIKNSQQYLIYIDYHELATRGLVGENGILFTEEKNGDLIRNVTKSDNLIYSNRNSEIFSDY